MDSVVIPRVEMAVRSITRLSGQVQNSAVEQPDQRDVWGSMENTPLMTAFSSTDSNINHHRSDEALNSENMMEWRVYGTEIGTEDRQAHTHHTSHVPFLISDVVMEKNKCNVSRL